MLTPELVRARRKDGRLELLPLSRKQRERALELAGGLIAAADEGVGRSRDELVEAWREITGSVRERRLADGLCKLVEDACEFSAQSPVDPAELRRAVFALAAQRRRTESGDFERTTVLAEVAPRFGLGPAEIDQALYSDLRGAHQLLEFRRMSPERLVETYESAQRQAVLLRAVRLEARVRCSSPAAYRALFNKLKFRRLLHRITCLDDGSYRIDIDGPFSLFESVTKYGLNLALCLPALEACDTLELQATLRWGKQRQALGFSWSHRAPAARADDARVGAPPDEIAELVDAVKRLDAGWRASPSAEILDLPGVGVCVPDLVFEHPDRRGVVHLEVLGYWSRDAVWRRVELVQSGLGARILFAVSSRLRVSEAVLPPGESAALYVYKGAMSARAVLRKIEQLARG